MGNHDKPRMSSSVGKEYISAINMMMLTLPGTPTTYYGEEIGMENVHIDIEDIQDPFGKFDPVSMCYTIERCYLFSSQIHRWRRFPFEFLLSFS